MTYFRVGLAALAVAVALSAAARPDEDEKELTVDQLPAAVKAAAETAAQGGKITEVESEMEAGQQIFSVEVVKEGKETEYEFAPDGKLLKTEVEDEDESDDDDDEGAEDDASEQVIDPAQAPAAVKAAADAASQQGGTSVTITREREGGSEIFEVEYLLNGKENSVEMTADGAVLEEESSVDPAALPAAVAAAVKKAAPNGEIVEAEEMKVHFFEIKVKQDGKVRELKLSPSGKKSSDDDNEDDDDDDDDDDDN